MEAFIILTILIIVFLVIGGRWAKNFFGCCCHECGTKMQPFEKLPDSDKSDILDYFRRFEDREPDVEGIFACGHCLLVYDDFSGEKRTMDGDERSFCKVCNSAGVSYIGPMSSGDMEKFQERNKHLIEQIECLRCKRNPMGIWDCVPCDTDIKVTACRRCYSIYAQMPVNGSRYRFQVQLSDNTIIKESPDSKWGVFEFE
ncbi:MAG: hypothetical protein F4W91_20585 [Gemmatimonadetes bacterium]|nr:hypothetical protein [Gemmatimonadota bacterium]